MTAPIAALHAFLDGARGEVTKAFAATTWTGLEATARYVVRSGSRTADEIRNKVPKAARDSSVG